MRICPGTPQIIHRHFLVPFLEGIARINLAWQGVDFRPMDPLSIRWSDRIIAWLIGTVLLIPFVNNLVWAFWPIFASREKYSEPYCPEIEPPPQKAIPSSPSPNIIPLTPSKKRGEAYVYEEDFEKSKIHVHCEIRRDSGLTYFTQNSSAYTTSSTYEANGKISKYNHKSKGKIFEASLTMQGLETSFKDKSGTTKKTFKLEEKLPWIQQATIGFRDFLAPENREPLFFYCLLPENPVSSWLESPVLLKALATKKGIEEVAGMGKLFKVEVAPTDFPYSQARAGELWFEPDTWILKKFVEPGMPGSSPKGGLLIQNHSLPAPAHP